MPVRRRSDIPIGWSINRLGRSVLHSCHYFGRIGKPVCTSTLSVLCQKRSVIRPLLNCKFRVKYVAKQAGASRKMPIVRC